MISTLAESTRRGEYCAVVDASDCFDPVSASRAGVALENLLWVRCHTDAGAALKTADILLHSGGFGVVCLDLSDISQRILNRLPSSYWFRFRRAIESTPTILLVLSRHPNVRSCAIRSVECRQAGVSWTGHEAACLLDSLRTEAVPHRPVLQTITFDARA
jgi:recA bacterial DNA recombination protein